MKLREDKNAVSIACGDWDALVIPETGMNMISVRYKGEEIMNVPETLEELNNGGQCRYGCPLLLPPNRTRGGKFTFEGKTYEMEINEAWRNNNLHGGKGLQMRPFTVTEATPSSVKGFYDHAGDGFPFRYRAEVTIEATGSGMKETIVITNIGDCNMPLTFGLHNTFKDKPFSVPIAMYRETNGCSIPTGRLLSLTDEQKTYTDGTYEGGTLIDTFFTSCGHTAVIGDTKFTVSDNFDSWIIWNGNTFEHDHGFIAVEPQQGAPNALNSGDGLHILAPGQSETFSISLSK